MTSTETNETAEPKGNESAAGAPNEVELRSPDGGEGNRFRKVYVCQGSGFDQEDHPSHNANKAHTLEEAIQRGLHPKGDPELTDAYVQSANRRGVETWEVVYEVDVVPASVDEEPPSDTVSPRAFIEDLGGTTEGETEPTSVPGVAKLADDPGETPTPGIRRSREG